MSAWSWRVHLCGRASSRMFLPPTASYFGATDAAAGALTSWHFSAGTSVRIGDLGGRDIMTAATA
eukprot:9501917-Pyramimonas_sp.AAC.1